MNGDVSWWSIVLALLGLSATAFLGECVRPKRRAPAEAHQENGGDKR